MIKIHKGLRNTSTQTAEIYIQHLGWCVHVYAKITGPTFNKLTTSYFSNSPNIMEIYRMNNRSNIHVK